MYRNTPEQMPSQRETPPTCPKSDKIYRGIYKINKIVQNDISIQILFYLAAEHCIITMKLTLML